MYMIWKYIFLIPFYLHFPPSSYYITCHFSILLTLKDKCNLSKYISIYYNYFYIFCTLLVCSKTMFDYFCFPLLRPSPTAYFLQSYYGYFWSWKSLFMTKYMHNISYLIEMYIQIKNLEQNDKLILKMSYNKKKLLVLIICILLWERHHLKIDNNTWREGVLG